MGSGQAPAADYRPSRRYPQVAGGPADLVDGEAPAARREGADARPGDGRAGKADGPPREDAIMAPNAPLAAALPSGINLASPLLVDAADAIRKESQRS